MQEKTAQSILKINIALVWLLYIIFAIFLAIALPIASILIILIITPITWLMLKFRNKHLQPVLAFCAIFSFAFFILPILGLILLIYYVAMFAVISKSKSNACPNCGRWDAEIKSKVRVGSETHRDKEGNEFQHDVYDVGFRCPACDHEFFGKRTSKLGIGRG